MRTKLFLVLSSLTAPLLAAQSATPSLERYVGQYPSTKLKGVDFRHHPVVRRAVAGAISSRIAKTILNDLHVESPIRRAGSLLISEACEAHSCNTHQGTVVVRSPGGPGAVCYYNEDLMGAEGRWFVSGRPIYNSPAGCWSGDSTAVPDRVRAALLRAQR